MGAKLEWEGGCGRGKKPDWLESTFHAQPSPPAPSATAADTCLNTYTSSTPVLP